MGGEGKIIISEGIMIREESKEVSKIRKGGEVR